MADQGTRDLGDGGKRLSALIVTGHTDMHHDWWPTELEPRVRSMYEARKAAAS